MAVAGALAGGTAAEATAKGHSHSAVKPPHQVAHATGHKIA
jgi:hypothetical protein